MARVEREIVQTTEPMHTDVVEEPVGLKSEQLIYWVVGIIEALLAIRFVLTLLGANRGNLFAQFIYNVTYPFVAPFFGLFNNTFQYGIARFEAETLVAIAVVALIGWTLGRLVAIMRR